MKNICIIGGGHGTSRLIKGFKDIDAKIDIIVASSDNGGHTGEIIKEFNVPALGDLRMVLESLLDEPLLNFFSYRFKNLHGKNKVSLGNLMLLSMVLENNSNIEKTLEQINERIDEKYTLHLANHEYTELKAITQDGCILSGEVTIGESNNIKDIYFDNEGIIPSKVINAIKQADVIVLSFGSFYTSIGSVISHKELQTTIKESEAEIVYVANLVNQEETKGYYLENYVDFLESKIGRKLDKIILSNSKIKRKIQKRYKEEGKSLVHPKENRKNYSWYPLVVLEDSKLRHDYFKVAQIINNGL